MFGREFDSPLPHQNIQTSSEGCSMATKAQIDKVVATLWADRKYYRHDEGGMDFFEESGYGTLGSEFWNSLSPNFRYAIEETAEALADGTYDPNTWRSIPVKSQAALRKILLGYCEGNNEPIAKDARRDQHV